MIKDIFIFQNGNIAVCDENGEQTELQIELNNAKKHLWWKDD